MYIYICEIPLLLTLTDFKHPYVTPAPIMMPVEDGMTYEIIHNNYRGLYYAGLR